MKRRSFLKVFPSSMVAMQAGCSDTKGRARSTQHAYCRLCSSNCGLEFQIAGDEIISVRGDRGSFTKGYCCPTGASVKEILKNPSRLRYPLKKQGRDFKRCSWGEALDAIAGKLSQLKERSGPRTIAMQTGYVFVRHPIVHSMMQCCSALGTPNFSSIEGLCEAAVRLGETLTYGQGTFADFLSSEVIVLWGANPFKTLPVYWDLIVQRMGKGAKLVVIDPYTTVPAQCSDLFLQPFPGTDLWLALWLCKTALNRADLSDNSTRRFIGIRRFKESLVGLTLDTVADKCGLDKRQIDQAAALMIPNRSPHRGLVPQQARPVSIQLGLGVQLHREGIQTIRAISILKALTGNLNRRGGNRFHGPISSFDKVTIEEPPSKPLGFDEHPFFYLLTGKSQNNLLPQAVLQKKPYPIRSLILFGSNLLKTGPDNKAFLRAIEELELFVVIDPLLTETAKHADFVLPAALFPEKDDLLQMGGRLFFQPKLVPPLGHTRSEWEILLGLARRLKLSPFSLFDSAAQLIEERVSSFDLSLLALAGRGKWGMKIPGQADSESRARAKQTDQGLNTPSGKIEIYSASLAEYGHCPMPEAPGPGEEASGDQQDYPLLLITGAKRIPIINSSFENLPLNTITQKRPIAQIHPRTARLYDLPSDREIAVETPYGKLRSISLLTDRIKEGTVYMPSFFFQDSINVLTSYAQRDPISGYPNLRSLRCLVRKA